MKDTEGNIYQADTFADLITLKEAKPIARYNSSWYTGHAAATVNTFGKGRAYYVGCGLPQSFYDRRIEKVLSPLILKSIKAPDEVEITTREKDHKRFIFVMNFSDKPSRIFLDKEYTELIKGKRLKEEIKLDPFEVLILEKIGK